LINKRPHAFGGDVAGVPTVLVARTDAEAAKLLTSDFDERDKPFCTGERTDEGFFRIRIRAGISDCPGDSLRAARDVLCAKRASPTWPRPNNSLSV